MQLHVTLNKVQVSLVHWVEMAFLPVLIQFFTVAVKDGQFTVFVITYCSLLEQVRGSET